MSGGGAGGGAHPHRDDGHRPARPGRARSPAGDAPLHLHADTHRGAAGAGGAGGAGGGGRADGAGRADRRADHRRRQALPARDDRQDLVARDDARTRRAAGGAAAVRDVGRRRECGGRCGWG